MTDEIARLAQLFLTPTSRDAMARIEQRIRRAEADRDWDAAGKWQRVRYRVMRLRQQRDAAGAGAG